MSAVSIIVPTYNEAENMDLLLKRIYAVRALQDIDLEIVFSDGASTDETCQYIEKWSDKGKVKLVRGAQNEGLSAAVMAGAKAAAGEFVVVMDADLSHPPEVIPELIAPLLDGSCDMTIGSRYVTGGATPDWPISRKISSKIATFPARMLTDVKDPLAGFLAVRRERLACMDREVCGFKIGLELLATSSDSLRVKEIPITFRDRCYGTSKMGLQVIIDYLRQLLILVGIDPVPETSGRMVPILIGVLLVDCIVLTALLHAGIPPGTAQCWSLTAAAALGGAVCLFRYCRPLGTVPWKRVAEYIFGFSWVVLLVALLRSGLVASLSNSTGGLSTTAVFLIGLCGLILGYAANICYVFSVGRKRIRRDLVLRYYGLGVFLYLVLLRLMYLGSIPVLPEEVQHIEEVSRWSVWSLILSAPEAATRFGLDDYFTIFLFRGFVWFLWLLSAICVFSLARVMFDRATAFMSCLVFAVLPFFFGSGFFFCGDALLVFCWSCSLYILYRTLVNEVDRGWIWAGIALGLGMQIDMRMSALLAAVVVYIFMHEKDRQRLFSPMPYLALGVLLVTALPALLTGSGKEVVARPDWLNSLLGAPIVHSYLVVVLLLSPTGILAGGHGLLRWLRSRSGAEIDNVHDWGKGRKYILMMFFLPLLIFLLPGLYESGPVAAGGVIWLVLLPTMALTIGRKCADGNSILRLLQIIWWPTIGLLMAGYGIGFHLAVL